MYTAKIGEMTASTEPSNLPQFLFNYWRCERNAESIAREKNELKGWTASSLAEAYLKHQLDECRIPNDNQVHGGLVPASLSSITASIILEELSKSENLDADVKTIANALNRTALQQLLRDPRASYMILRAFYALPQSAFGESTLKTARLAIDIDEAVLRNERYIRSRTAAENADGKYLIGLDELSRIFGPGASDDGGPVTFTRKDPPKGGFEFLDELRERNMRIQPNDDAFAKNFERITSGALHGLDWENTFVAGGMALTALLHVDPNQDDNPDVSDCDINIYLYGLSPEAANLKVKHIYDVWSSNLPLTNEQKQVVKSSKWINLLPDNPNHRVNIILELFPSPTQVLLIFDLDACAIGFDGSRVLMLPRCARAIETGYSVFTMDLVLGHHLGDHHATTEERLFKCATRGFGLRILPSYAKSLEEDNLEAQTMGKMTMKKNSAESNESSSPMAHTAARNRKPYGPKEPGLKTLKRIAYLGKDFVQRFYFGATPLATFPAHSSTGGRPRWGNEAEWQEAFAKAKKENPETEGANQRAGRAEKSLNHPLISFQNLDAMKMHHEMPDGGSGLGNFELFMRQCEAWRLHARADAT